MSPEYVKACQYIGAAISTGVASVSAAVGEGQTAGYVAGVLGRQPGANEVVLREMLVSQAITEGGAIFALVISFILVFGESGAVDWARGSAIVSAGIAMGLGSMGPNLGSGVVGAEACAGIGRIPSQRTTVSMNMLIGQALAQTSAIFSLFVALMLLYAVPTLAKDQSVSYQMIKAGAYIGAGLSVGVGAMGSGLGVGEVASKACKVIARHSKRKAEIIRTMFLGSAVAETPVIFALVVSVLLIFI